MQKTEYSFEIIIHDDASTDNTPQIVRKYAEKYPDIIRPILQKENQFGLKVNPVNEFVFPMVRGKYVAICEGDDYWCDDEKLQLQISTLESNPESHFCVAGVQEVTADEKPLGIIHPRDPISESSISPEKFIWLASSYSFQTSSYVMRYDDWKQYIQNEPGFKKLSDIGDLPMLLYFGSKGQVMYVNRIMSCYRRGAATSYSARKNQWTDEKRIEHFERMIGVWRDFEEFSSGRFHDTCTKKIGDNMFGYCILRKKAKEFFESGNREAFNRLPKAKRVFVRIACVLRSFMKWYYKYSLGKREKKELAIWNA
jgi:glycosyltransferase involved in cell wall biosynthesis